MVVTCGDQQQQHHYGEASVCRCCVLSASVCNRRDASLGRQVALQPLRGSKGSKGIRKYRISPLVSTPWEMLIRKRIETELFK